MRVDSGYRSGDTVSVHYDAMLAKVISFAPRGRRPPRSWPGFCGGRGFMGYPQIEICLFKRCVIPLSSPGRPTPRFLEANPAVAPDPDLFMLAAALSRPVGWRNVYSQPVTHRFDAGEVTFPLSRGGPRLGEGAAW